MNPEIRVSVPSRGLHFSNTWNCQMSITDCSICFRPLTGTAFLKLTERPIQSAISWLFPSPHGDCISQISYIMRNMKNTVFPSPCGDCISQIPTPWISGSFVLLFPSPCGDCISQIMIFSVSIISFSSKFPSPCGDCISQIISNVSYEPRWFVSVPLRGLHFSNLPPYSTVIGLIQFPSPCGDCISQIWTESY